ncbi:MFS transporter, putative metabolite:H+ symporter [Enhydrobacter aerosaccus]|uniref:MFS transporter, putative metabolite:H+ symporter n=1 Tax=Enhydrobacter aerosaccus TaxID=225324 RepID=A0A1T4TMV8_9HYPH|nr:MFS transporter [Enhydrobacter aerosaccus]SKA41823.1 MFS transporter, putative metabolite:H+ symporter [Enhydrobacter aerosaccus]
MTTNPARSEDLLALYDRAPLDRRYWTIFALLAVGIALDFFDFFIVSYLVAAVGPKWHLTYGQSAAMLLSGGVGAIMGALAWGSFSDAWGRKKLLVASTFICAAGSGAIALVPDGDWLLFSGLRFIVGVGLAACATPITTLSVELTPTRHRTFITGLLVVFATVGGFLAALVAATLLGLLGWRGVAAVGVLPAVMGVLFLLLLPESARWLVAKGRFAEAQATVARTLGLRLDQVPLPSAKPASEPGHSLAELLVRPRFFWLTVITWTGLATAAYGIYLWGPTIIALLLKIPVAQAAHYFVYVALAGITGKVVISWLAQKIGRKRTGEIQAYISALGLVVAGLCFPMTIGGFPVFILALVIAIFFLDGGASNLAPYIVEVYGVRLGARSAGLSQAANGVGKILGPLCLAVIAGADNPLSPQATADAVLPAFLFLGACALAVGLAFSFLGLETHGQPLALDQVQQGGRADALKPAQPQW